MNSDVWGFNLSFRVLNDWCQSSVLKTPKLGLVWFKKKKEEEVPEVGLQLIKGSDINNKNCCHLMSLLQLVDSSSVWQMNIKYILIEGIFYTFPHLMTIQYTNSICATVINKQQ